MAFGQFEFVNLGFDLDLFHTRVGFEISHLNLVVKVANVAHDRVVLHGLHVLEGDDVFVSSRGHENVGIRDGFVHGDHFVAFHGGLERTNGVDLGHFDPAALASKGLGATLAHVPVAEDDGHFARKHHIGCTHDAVGQRVPTAVEVVEFALGDGIVDVDGWEEQQSHFRHLVQAVDARGGFFRDAPNGLSLSGEVRGVHVEYRVKKLQHDLVLVVVRGLRGGDFAFFFELGPFVDQKRGVATVIQYQIGLTIAPMQSLERAPPIFLQTLAFPGKDWNTRRCLGGARANRAGGRSMVLGGEDVAGSPPDLCPQGRQSLNEGRSLHGHVQGAGDLGAFEGLAGAISFTQSHQTWHFVFGKIDLFSPEPEGFGGGAGHFVVVFREQWEAGVEEGCGGRIGGGHVESLGRFSWGKPVYPVFRVKYRRLASVPQN